MGGGKYILLAPTWSAALKKDTNHMMTCCGVALVTATATKARKILIYVAACDAASLAPEDRYD